MNLRKLSRALKAFCFKSVWGHKNLSLIQQYVYVKFFAIQKSFKKTLQKKPPKTFFAFANPLTMDYEGSKSARDNFSKFINQTPIKNQSTSQETWKGPNKIVGNNVSLLFNQTCL